MRRRAVLIIVATVLTSLLFAVVATSGGVGLWKEPTWDPAPQTIDPIEIERSTDESDPPPPPRDSERTPIELPAWLQAILRVLLVTAVIAAIIAMLATGYRRRPRLRWHRRSSGDGDFDVLPDVAAAVVDEAVAQRAMLLTGAPRNAIVRCWLRLERDVAAAGLNRRPADTSAEFTERVLANYSVDPAAIRDLAGLYREARFSEHELDEGARHAALDALDRLHQALTDAATGDHDGRADHVSESTAQ